MDLCESKKRKLGTAFWGVEVPLHIPGNKEFFFPGIFSISVFHWIFMITQRQQETWALSEAGSGEEPSQHVAVNCKLTWFRVWFLCFPSEPAAGYVLCQRTVQRDGAAGREELCHTHLSEPGAYVALVTSVERSGMHPPVNLVHGNAAYRTGNAPAEFSSRWQRQQPYIMLAINVSNPCKCSLGFGFFLVAPCRNSIYRLYFNL